MEKPKFEIKPIPPTSIEKEPEPEREIETWEGEGGTVETQAAEGEPRPEGGRGDTLVEVPETVVEESRVEKSWREILIQAKDEFPEDVQRILNKDFRGGKLRQAEYHKLDHFAQLWFREIFGMRIKKKMGGQEQPKKGKPAAQEKKQLTGEELADQQRKIEEQRVLKSERRKKIDEEKSAKLAKLEKQKRNKIEQLHRALRNLDNGEPVEEFRDETRRIVYFDEENQEYFVEEGGSRKVVGTGDIVSDYAWGIKYAPDGEMTEPAYRTVAKRILTNETRRDLERIYNGQLRIKIGVFSSVLSELSRIKDEFAAEIGGKEMAVGKKMDIMGTVGEIIVREFLSRISLNNNLDFAVSRATVEEDANFKYDFKVRFIRRLRGVGVESSPAIKSLGFQLKTRHKKKEQKVVTGEYLKGKKGEVDDVLFLTMPGKDMLNSFKKWLESGEPSGGPEQFLSPELKKAILKAVTEKLIDVPQEVYDKIE